MGVPNTNEIGVRKGTGSPHRPQKIMSETRRVRERRSRTPLLSYERGKSGKGLGSNSSGSKV